MSFKDLSVSAFAEAAVPDTPDVGSAKELSNFVTNIIDADASDTKPEPMSSKEIDTILSGGSSDGADGLRSLMRKYAEEFGDDLV